MDFVYALVLYNSPLYSIFWTWNLYFPVNSSWYWSSSLIPRFCFIAELATSGTVTDLPLIRRLVIKCWRCYGISLLLNCSLHCLCLEIPCSALLFLPNFSKPAVLYFIKTMNVSYVFLHNLPTLQVLKDLSEILLGSDCFSFYFLSTTLEKNLVAWHRVTVCVGSLHIFWDLVYLGFFMDSMFLNGFQNSDV